MTGHAGEAVSSNSGASAWVLRKAANGIEVYTRKSVNSAIDEVRAQAEIDAPLSSLAQLLQDLDRRQHWDGMLANAALVNTPNSDLEYHHLSYNMPWPVSNRDVVMQVQRTISEEAITIENIAVRGIVTTQPGVVRIHQGRVTWHLHKLSASRTRLVTIAHLDPNGPIPAWLLNSLSVSKPYAMIEEIRRQVTL